MGEAIERSRWWRFGSVIRGAPWGPGREWIREMRPGDQRKIVVSLVVNRLYSYGVRAGHSATPTATHRKIITIHDGQGSVT